MSQREAEAPLSCESLIRIAEDVVPPKISGMHLMSQVSVAGLNLMTEWFPGHLKILSYPGAILPERLFCYRRALNRCQCSPGVLNYNYRKYWAGRFTRPDLFQSTGTGSDCSGPTNEVEHQRNQRHNKQNVDQSARDVENAPA